MLRSAPQGLPAFVDPHPALTPPEMKNAEQLKGAAFVHALKMEGLEACAEFNFKCVVQREILVHKFIEESTPPGQWGRLCEVGACDEHRGVMREVTAFWNKDAPATNEGLWMLPEGPNGEHKAAVSLQFHFSTDKDMLESRPLPLVRYADQRRQDCPVVEHPNNSAHASRARNGAVWQQNPVPAEPEAFGAPNIDLGSNNTSHVRGPSSADNNPWEEGNFRKEVPLDGCKPGALVIGLQETEDGTQFLYVGQVTRGPFYKEQDEYPYFTYKPFQCTENSWEEKCVTEGKWRKKPGRQKKEEEQPHYSVIMYFNKLTQQNKLPAAVKKAVQDRGVKFKET
jgi:hypothetical protein